MSGPLASCADLVNSASSGVAPALAAVDCMSQHIAAGSFARLLGPSGVFGPALLSVLTIYVAIFALMLLSGRVRLRAAPGRIMLIGLVLAFSTSWAAYSTLVWQVAEHAPDEVAGVLTDTSPGNGTSATASFAEHIDTVFAAVSDAAREAAQQESQRVADASQSPQAPVPGANPAAQTIQHNMVASAGTGGMSASAIAWFAAMILLLSTVGVLVTARIVLAVLLMLGPIFLVTSLFVSTRALFAGWLRATALAALAPMLAVLSGALSLELAVPVVARLLGPDGIEPQAAMGFFLIAAVHAALMFMALRAAGQLVTGWKPWNSRTPRAPREAIAPGQNPYTIARTPLMSQRSISIPERNSPLAYAARGSTPGSASMSSPLVFSARGARLGETNHQTQTSGLRRASGIGRGFRSPPKHRKLV